VVVEGDLRIEARPGSQRDRKDRAEAMDGVECEQHRNPQPGFLDRNLLELSDSRCVGHAEDRAETLAHLGLGDQKVRQQLDLLQLLLERHLREQAIHLRLDPSIGRLSRGLERLLVARLCRGDYATRD
jgi:hypothetical protein